MEEKNENSKTVSAVVIIIILIAVLVGYFFVKSNKDKEIKNTPATNTNTNIESNENDNEKVTLLNYPTVQNSTFATITTCGGESTLSIENGKVVLTDSENNKTIDTSITEEVVSIVQAHTSCDCGSPNHTAVFTKDGNAYLFVGYPKDMMSADVTLKFEQIKGDKTFIGLAALRNKILNTCSSERLYAFTDDNSAYLVEIIDDGETYGNATLGNLYQEIYPYDDWMLIDSSNYPISLTGIRLVGNAAKIEYEGKLETIKDAEGEMRVIGIFPKKDSEEYILISEDKRVYTLKIEVTDNKLNYTITEEEKIVSSISVSKDDSGSYNVIINYTDSTFDNLEEAWDSEFLSLQK